MVLTRLPNLLPFLVVSSLIAGFGCLAAASIFERRSTRFVLRVGLPVVIVAVVGGAHWLLKARHLDAEYRWMRAFQTERSVALHDGTILETDFTAPTTDFTARRVSEYLVTLPDLLTIPPSSPEEHSTVDCTVVADGQNVSTDSSAIDALNIQKASSPGTVIARFWVAGGKTYHVSLRISPAVARREGEMVRLRFSYYLPALYGAYIGIGMISGIGESWWLAAYGVFVAAAIRVGLNWRDAADRRAFLAGQPPP